MAVSVSDAAGPQLSPGAMTGGNRFLSPKSKIAAIGLGTHPGPMRGSGQRGLETGAGRRGTSRAVLNFIGLICSFAGAAKG